MSSHHAPFLRFSYTRGLCDWCAPPGGVCRCCYVCWCFPCAFGNLAERLGPNEIICGQNWCGGCLLAWLSSYMGAPCLVMSPARLSVRNKYGIKGDTCEDIICGWCCAPCLLCQLLNEVDINTARGVGTEFGPPPGLPPPAVYVVAVPGQAVATMAQYVPPQPELPPPPHQHQRQQQRHGYVKMG